MDDLVTEFGGVARRHYGVQSSQYSLHDNQSTDSGGRTTTRNVQYVKFFSRGNVRKAGIMKLRGLSQQANYNDRAAAAGRRS